MKTPSTRLGLLMALTLLTVFCLSAFVLAADNDEQVVPRFVVIPPKPAAPGSAAPANTLQEWNGSFTYNNHQYNYVMVGADPSTNQAALIPTIVIPVKIVLSGGQTYDPLMGGVKSALARTILSPVFDTTTNYTQGGINLGTTQYIDAFQRGNFWSIVQNNPNSRLLLGAAGVKQGISTLPELTLNVPAADGHVGNPFGFPVGEVDINYFDSQISAYMAGQPAIQPNTFPIFLVNDVYLTSGGGCCIGGYHSANGAQTYAQFDYDDHPGVFSQDVSALSHEVGEWADDPLSPSENFTPCGILEVGDPLEGGSNGHPYGTWVYPLHGFNYHLQDLVWIGYFGAPLSTSANSWYSFQDFPFTRICQNGS